MFLNYFLILSSGRSAVEGFAVPLPHLVRPVPPVQLPAALISAKYVFVREDSAKSSLTPRYRGPYLVIDRRDKYFRLQMGLKQDVVSVDRLKPVFSDTPAPAPSTTRPLSTTKPSKKVRFLLNPQVVPPLIPLRRNPHRAARDRRISPPFLLGGLLCRI